MRKGKLLALLAGLVLAMGLVLVGCDSGGGGGSGSGGSGVGTDSSGNVALSGTTWKGIREQPEKGFTYTYTLTFTSTSAYTMTSVVYQDGAVYDAPSTSSGTYTVNKSAVTLTESSGSTSGTVSGNKMTLTGGGRTVEFTKQ